MRHPAINALPLLLLAACGGGESSNPPVVEPAIGVVITAVTGPIQHGGTVVITGSGFGVKSPVAPYFYDDFEGGAVGATLWGKPGAVGSALWKMYDGGAKQDSLYVADGYRGQGVKRVSIMNDFRDGYIDQLASTQAYVSYRFKYSHTGANDGVMKIFRMASLEGANPVYSGQSSLLLTYQPKADWLYSILSTNGLESGSTNKTVSASLAVENTWHRIEGYMKLSSPTGEANGEYFLGTQNAHAAEKNKVTRVAGNTSLLDSFLLPFTSANGGTAPEDSFSQWADDVYFDNTQARVELCDQALWSSTIKRCDIQIPHTQWVKEKIQIRLNQGAFTSGQTAYVYVIDANGQVNAEGFPVQVL